MNNDLITFILCIVAGVVIFIIAGTIFILSIYTIARKFMLWLKRKK